MTELKKTGIDILADMPWGSHFCNFYETKEDLLDTLVRYFKAGLERKEFCRWVVTNPELITREEAKTALAQAVPDLDRHLSNGDIEIVDDPDWYLEEHVFNFERVTTGWDAKLKLALTLGYDGIRVSEDTFSLEKKSWKDFNSYEKQLNDFITGLPMKVMCTYSLEKSAAVDLLHIVHAHQFAIASRQVDWEVIETPGLTQARAEINRLNEKLELRVIERTRKLESAYRELRNEINERKNAEEALAKSENHLRAILQTEPECVKLLGKNGELEDMNPAGLAMIEADSLEQVKGKSVLNLINKHYRKAFQKLTHTVFQGQSGTLEFEITGLKGTCHWLEMHAVPLKDAGGKIIYLLGITRDITERKKTEQALKTSEETKRLIMNSALDAIIGIETGGRIIIWTPQAEKIFGWKEEEVMGKKIAETIIPVQYRERHTKGLEKYLKTGEGPVLYKLIEITALNRQDEEFPIELTIVPITQGEIKFFCAFLRDISKRKKAEEELHQVNEELRSLSSHLQNVREEERIQIARDIHDDLGQQLSGLKMEVSWLNKKLETADGIIKQKINGVIELIDETLKSVKRISSDLRPSILDDFGLIAAIQWHSSEVAKRTEIKVNFTADMPEPDIPIAVATGIFRIYQELLTNAVRHSNAHVITSSLQLKDSHLILEVKDDGQGIDQTVTSTKKTLGLIGIKERTFVLGGRYDLKSTSGKGTVVQISIPL